MAVDVADVDRMVFGVPDVAKMAVDVEQMGTVPVERIVDEYSRG
jgi:hypothetical protein